MNKPYIIRINARWGKVGKESHECLQRSAGLCMQGDLCWNRCMDFWDKSLHELNGQQWEALCDGCGQCCRHKFEDEDTAEMLYTDVACRLFDQQNCRCSDYPNRRRRVPECMTIRSFHAGQYAWLPSTCAYRLRHEGKPLYDWHPLISGTPESVHDAGISVRGACVPESEVAEDDWPDHIIGAA